jgi:hypothetical protein
MTFIAKDHRERRAGIRLWSIVQLNDRVERIYLIHGGDLLRTKK